MMKHRIKNTMGMLATSAALVMFASSALAQSASADGEIRKLDVNGSRVIIKHGDWQGMQMGAMTMAFKVRQAALLDGLKVNDKVHFAIQKDGSDYVVTAIEHVAHEAVAAAVAVHLHAHVHADKAGSQ